MLLPHAWLIYDKNGDSGWYAEIIFFRVRERERQS